MYMSAFATAIYLVPLQATRARGGRKPFVAAAAVAFSCIAIFSGLVLSRAGVVSAVPLVLSMLSPAAIAGGIVLLNGGFLRGRPFAERLMVSGAMSSIAMLPIILSFQSDPELKSAFREMISAMLRSAGEENLGEPELAALFEAAVRITNASFGFVVTSLLYLNYWIGTRAGGRAAKDGSLMPRIPELTVGRFLIWPLLVSWACILATRFMPIPVFEAVAWNIALVLAFGYALQGSGVIAFVLARLNPPLPLRIAFVFAVALMATNGIALVVAASVLTLLGVTETWVPYRQTKGVDHEGNPE